MAQSYGLGFLSHEIVQDKRTGLDLSPSGPICFKDNFEVSFDFAFLPNHENHFGYIVRIINNEKQNIDLLFDRRLDNNPFKLIIGEQISNIAFNIDPKKVVTGWTNIKIRFDIRAQLLTLKVGANSYSQHIQLPQNNCFKVLFGSNDYLDFKTNDVPPMKIRDVIIAENQKVTHKWPLNEANGNTAHDDVNNNAAQIINPLWIKKLHYTWQPVQKLTVSGAASITFDPASETVYVASADSLISYSVPTGKLGGFKYLSGSQFLIKGNQSFYNKDLKKFFNINVDQKQVATLDFDKKTWDIKHNSSAFETNFWHSNKFYSPIDSSIYIIGGYGQFFYKNDIQRYNINSKKWELVKTTGENLTPRYLAALGSTGAGAYILGGYGNTSGQQILNPKSLYDLVYFDVKTHSFKKVYELSIKGEDFVFANSMVVNKKANSYYALIFPKHKYNSHLQLVAGSLSKPVFETLGNEIPFVFHDISSFADLYYCPDSKKFIAVTLFLNEKNQTIVSLYALSSPPIANIGASDTADKQPASFLWFVVLGLIGLSLITVIYYNRKNKAKKQLIQTSPNTVIPVTVNPTVGVDDIIIVDEDEAINLNNKIFLFGDLQMFDNQGDDITKYLTPLTKELFLIIALYTIRWGRGITSEKLKEILWFDKSAESARNNRSVNIAKLKQVLDKMDSCVISKESGHWKIKIDPQHIDVDYQRYLDIVNDKRKLDKQKISDLARIIQRGSFLADVQYEWLDTFKAEITNEIIDTYLQYAASLNVNDDPEFLIKLANYIFYFDPVNEEAMALKCKSLISLGKHSLAKSAYDSFCKEYKLIYGECFQKDFNNVIG
jgi:DNA-binding SARP family transcriptional activator